MLFGEPMTLAPFSTALFITSAAGLNKKASAKRARWAAHIGRPYRLSPTDPRPDPGTIDLDVIDG